MLVKYGDICHLKKNSFFTEVGKMIQGENAQIKKEGYVVLATFQAEHKLRNLNENINNMDLSVAKKYLRNQVVNSKKDYHFGTTGRIHGFGFGPVYSSNAETGHSIEKFAKSKYLLIK